MTIKKIPFHQVPQFSSRDVAYVEGDKNLSSFYKYPVTLEAFAEVIRDKSEETIDRTILVRVLKDQYLNLDVSPLLDKNITSLSDNNTFTIVTAHQPSLFTGPLYYVYKIISTIHLAKQLNAAYSDHHIVPVFVTGGEDHDFEEVQKAHVFNQTLVWENDESGSVGMMQTGSLAKVLAKLKALLGENSENAIRIFQKIEAAYTQNALYSAATVQLVNSLFGEDGLVVLNMNHPDLKRQFIPILKEELVRQPSHQLVEATADALNEVGFKTQATPREINLFYLQDQLRERIVREDEHYHVLNTNLSFNEFELLKEVDQHPERFSPNVVLRPLYQEKVLPNLAYIGGGGELAYWLERKTQFEHFGINYPMLIRRNSVLWLDKGIVKKMNKLGLTVEELFQETEDLIKTFLKKNADEPLHLTPEKAALKKLFADIAEKIQSIDPTLVSTVKAEGAKQEKSLQQLEGRLMRAEKQRHDVAVQQIRSLKEKLFYHNGLQERRDNFLNFYTRYGESFFDLLKKYLNPLDKRMVVVVEEG